MDAFFENAQKIFDVARAAESEGTTDFALMIRPDGGLHLVMDLPLSPEAAAVHGGARTVYHVQRLQGGVRVTGQMPGRSCVLEEGGNSAKRFPLLRDQPLYETVSGSGGGLSRSLLTGISTNTAGGPVALLIAAA